MLLVEVTINGTLHYVSMGGEELTHYWDNQIVGFDPPQNQIFNLYGGYIRPGFGSIKFSHDLFGVDDWPPPMNVDVAVYYTATTEAAKETIFTGKAHYQNMTRDNVEYELYGESYSALVTDTTAFDDTLVNVATWFCNAARLNLTLNTTYARSPSPDVKFTNSGDRLAIDLFGDVCAFFTHCFYVSAGTLYLIDMLADASTVTLTEFDFYPSEYTCEVPAAIVRSTNYSRVSTYPYGNELELTTEYVDTQVKVETALDNILTVVNRRRCRLKMPFLGSLPTPGKKISWTDTSLKHDLDVWIRSRTLTFDFENEVVTVEGEGELS